MGGQMLIKFLLKPINVIFVLILLTGNLLAASERPIAIFLSDSIQAYKNTAEDFSSSIDMPVKIFNLQGDIRKDPGLKKRLFDSKPRLILSLGAKAAFVAKFWTKDRQEIPVIFANVLNWSKYKLLSGQNNITGISAETAPGNQFTSIALFAPDLKRVGVIYNKNQSQHIIEQAQFAANVLGLELVTRTIKKAQEFRSAYNQLANQVDAFWMLNDPVSFTIENIAWVNKRCIQYRLVCLGQSENAAKLGFLLSVNPDQKNIGSQAASLAKSILQQGKSPGQFGAMPPLTTEILVNLKTAKQIGLHISADALFFATQVID